MEIKLSDEQRKIQQHRGTMSFVIGLTSMFAAGVIIWSDTHSLIGWIAGSGILFAAAAWEEKIAAWVYPEHEA